MTPNTQSVQERLNRQWWLADEGKEHERLMPLRERLNRQDSDRRQTVLKHMRMYGGYGPGKNAFNKPDRLRYNVCEQAVDTLLAEISTNKPKAAFLTTGGDWTLRQGAKECELVTESQMRASGIYSGLARQVLRDAEVCSFGFVEVYIDWETLTPKAERGLWNELLVDEADGRYGKPRNLTRQHLIDRGVALARWGTTPERKKAIEDAPRFTSADQADEWMMNPAEFNESDLILVVKAWHLPSSPKAKDGRFVVCIDGATLWSEEHTRDRFPLVILRWGEELVGFWGKSVVGQLEADQIELNRTLRRIQEAAGVAAGMWLLDRAAKVRQRHLTDLPGTTVEYTGSKPEYQVPGTVPGDLVNHALGIIDRALQRIGVSQMFASAMKPAGLNSGEAQRVHSNIFSQRQIEHTDAYEAWHVDVARAFVDANMDIAQYLASDSDEKNKREIPEVSVQVKRGRKTVLKRMRFKESNLPENAFILQAYPMSSLPSEPSGRQATIGDWIELGLIDQTDARALMHIPDTESFMDLKLADYDFALWAFETMMEDGEYVSPEPFQKLDLGLELVRVSYLRAVIDGAPEARLDLVRDHMTALKALIKKAMTPPPSAEAVPADPSMAALPPDAALAALPAPAPAGIDPSTLPVAA